MTNERRVLVHPDKEALAGSVAARFITKIIDVLEEQEQAHVCLTGGTMGSRARALIRSRTSTRGSSRSFEASSPSEEAPSAPSPASSETASALTS